MRQYCTTWKLSQWVSDLSFYYTFEITWLNLHFGKVNLRWSTLTSGEKCFGFNFYLDIYKTLFKSHTDWYHKHNLINCIVEEIHLFKRRISCIWNWIIVNQCFCFHLNTWELVFIFSGWKKDKKMLTKCEFFKIKFTNLQTISINISLYLFSTYQPLLVLICCTKTSILVSKLWPH